MSKTCWADLREYVVEKYGYCSKEHLRVLSHGDATCLLKRGHKGKHKWTLDSDIVLMFKRNKKMP